MSGQSSITIFYSMIMNDFSTVDKYMICQIIYDGLNVKVAFKNFK